MTDITSSVGKLKKSHLYRKGVEFHQQSNGIGSVTFLHRLQTTHQNSDGYGGAARYKYDLYSRRGFLVFFFSWFSVHYIDQISIYSIVNLFM